MTHVYRRSAVFAVLAIVGVALAGLLLAAGAGGASAAPAPANATDPGQHVDPAGVDASGDLEAVRGWLSERLSERLDEQTLHLSRGEFEAAAGLLDEEYERRLAQYVDLGGEPDGDGGGIGRAYERAGTNQRTLVTVVSEYESTYDEYRAARARGDGEAAQRTARRLEAIADRVDRRAGNASSGLQAVEDRAGVETDRARDRIAAVHENVTDRQARVRQTTLTETTIEAEANGEVAAFDRPVEITGRLRTSRDEPLANKRVHLEVGRRTYEPETDGDGRFAVTYRPVAVDAGATAVNVTYRPATSTPYLAASTTVPLSIRQVDADVTVSVDPSTARLGTDLRVAASVGVGDRVVPELPMDFAIAEQSASTDRTDVGGVANANWSVPADVQPGEYVVRVTGARPGAAVQAPETTRSVTVERTATELSVDATQRGDAVSVDGRLQLADAAAGASLPASLPVTVTVGDQTETVRTDPDGHFEHSVGLSSIGDEAEGVTVRAQFDGAETNLGPAMFERTVPLSGDGGLAADLGTETLAAVAGVALVGLFVVAFLAWRWLRGRRAGSGESQAGGGPRAVAGADGPAGVGAGPAGESPVDADGDWIAGARAAMADGAIERAVASSYAAAHGHVTAQLALEGVLTPRELLAAADGRLEPEALDALETLTDVYERVIFASEATEDAGELAIDAAGTVVEAGEDESTPPASAGGD